MNETNEVKRIEALVEFGWPEDVAELAVRNPGVRIDAIGSPGMSDERRAALGLDQTVDDFLSTIAAIEHPAKAS
jgi:hypothetical protein